MRRAVTCLVVSAIGGLALAGFAACGGDDSAPATTAVASSTTSTTRATTTIATTTVATTTTTMPDPAAAPPCNVGEIKVNRESKQYFEPGDPRYGTVPPPLVICLPSTSVAQSEGFAPAPPA